MHRKRRGLKESWEKEEAKERTPKCRQKDRKNDHYGSQLIAHSSLQVPDLYHIKLPEKVVQKLQEF